MIGRISHNSVNLVGNIYGRLTVIERLGSYKGKMRWRCMCTCGKDKVVTTSDLNNNRVKSCGCYNVERAIETNRKLWLPVDCGDHYDIPLNNGVFSKIDKEDFSLVKESKWCLNNVGYAVCTFRRKNVLMHRVIMDVVLEKDIEVDHIDHDTLNNRKSNLRICFHRDNLKNRLLSTNNTTGYPGVYRVTGTDNWYGRIIANGRLINLGVYSDKESCVARRIQAEKEFFGEFRNSQ